MGNLQPTGNSLTFGFAPSFGDGARLLGPWVSQAESTTVAVLVPLHSPWLEPLAKPGFFQGRKPLAMLQPDSVGDAEVPARC